jgi:hypothetical protein
MASLLDSVHGLPEMPESIVFSQPSNRTKNRSGNFAMVESAFFEKRVECLSPSQEIGY